MLANRDFREQDRPQEEKAMLTFAKLAKRALVLACLITLTAYAQAITPTGPLRVGQHASLSIDIAIAGVTDLLAYQFDLVFDPAILSATLVAEGPFLSSAGSTSFVAGTIDNTAGIIDNIANTLLGPIAGASGDGSLVTVTFFAKAVGVSPLQVSNVVLLDSSLSEIPFTVQDGSVTVEPIPEPGTAGMLALGALVIIGCRLRTAGSCKPGFPGAR
jgi:hypothetical protein